MDIFGIGPLELMLILILALVVFGPDKLPQIGSKLGKSVKEMRRATREFSKEVDSAKQLLGDPLGEIRDPLQEIAQPFQELKAQVATLSTAAKAIKDPGKAVRDSVFKEMYREDEPEEETTPTEPEPGEEGPGATVASVGEPAAAGEIPPSSSSETAAPAQEEAETPASIG